MDSVARRDTPPFEDRFTGCLLGMAIGDALGVPRAFRSPAEFPADPKYMARNGEAGLQDIPAGQFSLNTELALCLLETLATSNGFVDPELAVFRFQNAADRSAYLADQRELEAIVFAADSEEFQSGGNSQSTQYAGPAARVIPLALVHSLSEMNVALLTREVIRSVLITDGDPLVVNAGLAVAHALRMVMRQDMPLEILVDEVVSLIDEDDVARALRIGTPQNVHADAATVVAGAVHAMVAAGGELIPALQLAFERGGATHMTGAITGALCGAHIGASRIDQALINGLEGRAYVLMAAPALLRAAQLRAGLVFQLRLQ